MANKITMDSVHAFVIGRPFRRQNMEVTINGNWVYLYLYGNTIAMRDQTNGKVYIRNCGWETKTTKMRLNYLLYVYNSPLKIRQKNWVWYLGDKQWEGCNTYIYDEAYKVNTNVN
jgi:hypothetical protein